MSHNKAKDVPFVLGGARAEALVRLGLASTNSAEGGSSQYGHSDARPIPGDEGGEGGTILHAEPSVKASEE